MFKRLLFAGLAVAAIAPLAAQANGPVSVSVSTPQFGIRIGAPIFGPPVVPVYAPLPVYSPPVYSPPIYAPPVYAPPPVVYGPPVYMPRPRYIVPAPVVVAPRVVYPRPYYPPRVVTPYDGDRYHHYGSYGQQAVYSVPPGHVKRYTKEARYD